MRLIVLIPECFSLVEHCTGISEVIVQITSRDMNFLDLTFTTACVVLITAMIMSNFILNFALQIYEFHLLNKYFDLLRDIL